MAMNTRENQKQLLEKLKTMVANEKFQMDAYFMCGYPSKTPNEKLLRTCEKYLDAVSQGQADAAAAQTLQDGLEEALAAASEPNLVHALANSAQDIQQVLNLRALF